MFNLNFNGIKNTLSTYNLFNFSFNFFLNFEKKKNIKQELDSIEQTIQNIKEVQIYSDHKTTLSGSCTDRIEKLTDDLRVYLFIQKNKESSAWNLVAPVIYECSTGEVTQYSLGYFALQGSGGGLGSISSMFYHLKNHIKKGYKVSIFPKVVDNTILKNFEYVDSGLKLQDVIDKSTRLIHYQKDVFKWIYKQYIELVDKYDIVKPTSLNKSYYL